MSHRPVQSVSYASAAAVYTATNGTGDAKACPDAKDNTQNAYRFSPRTAIGLDRSKILLVVFQSDYEVRRFMISRGCSLAIMLDDGDS